MSNQKLHEKQNHFALRYEIKTGLQKKVRAAENKRAEALNHRPTPQQQKSKQPKNEKN